MRWFNRLLFSLLALIELALNNDTEVHLTLLQINGDLLAFSLHNVFI